MKRPLGHVATCLQACTIAGLGLAVGSALQNSVYSHGGQIGLYAFRSCGVTAFAIVFIDALPAIIVRCAIAAAIFWFLSAEKEFIAQIEVSPKDLKRPQVVIPVLTLLLIAIISAAVFYGVSAHRAKSATSAQVPTLPPSDVDIKNQPRPSAASSAQEIKLPPGAKLDQ